MQPEIVSTEPYSTVSTGHLPSPDCVPAAGGLRTFAPPLDETGNSMKGQRVIEFLSEELGLNLFASRPAD